LKLPNNELMQQRASDGSIDGCWRGSSDYGH
jgi:hypothetical protein